MNLIKKMKNGAAILLVLCFTFMLQIQARPIPAPSGDTAARIYALPDEDQGLVEIEDDEYKPAGKKNSLIPILIGLAAAGVVAAVLFLVVFKSSWDLSGNWDLTITSKTGYVENYVMICSGEKKEGTARLNITQSGTGSYKVNSKDDFDVTIPIPPGPTIFLKGRFDSKDRISGRITNDSGYEGTFTGTRKTAGSLNQPASANRDQGVTAKQ